MHAITSEQAAFLASLGTPPGGFVHVYTASGLALLALAGLAIAAAGRAITTIPAATAGHGQRSEP